MPSGQARRRRSGPGDRAGGNDVLHLGGGDDVGNGESRRRRRSSAATATTGCGAASATTGSSVATAPTTSTSRPAAGTRTVYDDVRPAEDDDGTRATTNGDGPDLRRLGPGRAAGRRGRREAARRPDDQLVDWVGPHNVYYVCDGAYGAGRIVRQSSPAMMDLLLTWPRPRVPGAETAGLGRLVRPRTGRQPGQEREQRAQPGAPGALHLRVSGRRTRSRRLPRTGPSLLALAVPSGTRLPTSPATGTAASGWRNATPSCHGESVAAESRGGGDRFACL